MIKTIHALLLLAVVFIVSAVPAFYFENYYRTLVQFFFKLFQGNRLLFTGKNVHLFTDNAFIVSFGVFSTCIVLLLRKAGENKLRKLSLVPAIFLLVTATTSFIDSSAKMITCTACQDGKLILPYNNIHYDLHFMMSLGITLLIVFTATLLIPRKKRREQENLFIVYS